MREITTTEPFLEAWPSIIIMTIIFLFAQWGEDRDKFYDYCSNNTIDHNYPNRYLDNECYEYLDYQPFNYQPPNYCTNHPENDQCAVYGGFGGGIWFFLHTQYLSSRHPSGSQNFCKLVHFQSYQAKELSMECVNADSFLHLWQY